MRQTLNDIKTLLAERGLHPRKRFGQNFLHDQQKMNVIIEAANLQKDELVLEVGPGTGALTCRLIEAGAHVVAVEIDRDMTAILRQQFGEDHDCLQLINDDILAGKHEINPVVIHALSHHSSPQISQQNTSDIDVSIPPFQLIANLPYDIASPLLINLFSDYPSITSAIVMIQKEVAQRIIARHGGKDFGPLSIMIQAICDAKIIARLSPNCFWPPPKIESSVIQLTRRLEPLTDSPRQLSAMCQSLFTKRRKQVGSILGRDFPFPDDIKPTQRPEQLSVEQIIALSKIEYQQ